MYREIKFRVFETELARGRMFSWEEIKSEFVYYLNCKETFVMQSTGMLDCDGKEIYENDIVQTVSKDGVRLSKFQIIWSESRCRFMKRREDESYYDLETSQLLLKIIGNIYENPELVGVAS